MNRMTEPSTQIKRHNRRLAKSHAGFTLLELLVAIMLLSIGLIATAKMQDIATNSNMLANRRSVAVAVAQQVMEEILSRRLDPPDSIFSSPGPNTLPESSITVPGAGTYVTSASVTIDPVVPGAPDAGQPVEGVARIEVTVTGDNKTITLVSYKRIAL